jgi:hypothetical protein
VIWIEADMFGFVFVSDVDFQGWVWWVWPIHCPQEVLLSSTSALMVSSFSYLVGFFRVKVSWTQSPGWYGEFIEVGVTEGEGNILIFDVSSRLVIQCWYRCHLWSLNCNGPPSGCGGQTDTLVIKFFASLTSSPMVQPCVFFSRMLVVGEWLWWCFSIFIFFPSRHLKGLFFFPGNINVNSYCMRNFMLVSICFHKPYGNHI